MKRRIVLSPLSLLALRVHLHGGYTPCVNPSLDERRGEEDWVERLLEEVRREFSGLPFYVGVEDGYVYVKKTAPMDQRQFRRYLETCKRLGFRFDRRGERWVKPLEELKTA